MKLGTWVHTQRIQYRKLVSVNTKDSGKDNIDPSSGKLSPSPDVAAANDPALQYTEENASEIAGWTVEQAQSYRLTDARRKRLEEVGFCWSARESIEKSALETTGRIARNSYDDQWDAMFDLLVKYKADNGDCLVVSFIFGFCYLIRLLLWPETTCSCLHPPFDYPAKALSCKPQARNMG